MFIKSHLKDTRDEKTNQGFVCFVLFSSKDWIKLSPADGTAKGINTLFIMTEKISGSSKLGDLFIINKLAVLVNCCCS